MNARLFPELFSSSRWGSRISDPAQVRGEMVARLDACIANLPAAVLSVHVSDSVVPAPCESFACFAPVYDRVCARVNRSRPKKPGCPRGAECETVEQGSRVCLREAVCETVELDSHACPRGAVFDAREALHMHMQKKLAGWILKFVWEGLDFLKLYCRQNNKGCISEEVKRVAFEMNSRLAVLCTFLGRMYQHQSLNKIASLVGDQKLTHRPKAHGSTHVSIL